MREQQYQQITDRIVAMLESGVRPWVQSWSAQGGGRPLRENGQPYRGMNTVNLWAAAMARGFASPYWLTFNRAKALGAKVKKGAKAELAFYANTFRKTDEETGKEKFIPFLKAFPVFNADEIEGLPAHFYAKAPVATLDPAARIAHADEFMAATGAKINHGGGRAYYRPSTDEIQMPVFESFVDAPAYYGTALHELAHWSGAPCRLDRTKGKLFGDPAYAFEELVAELSAAFLSADLGIATEPREDHASYIASWLKALKADNKAIFSAAAFAEKAATFLNGLQGGEAEESGEPELAEAA